MLRDEGVEWNEVASSSLGQVPDDGDRGLIFWRVAERIEAA